MAMKNAQIFAISIFIFLCTYIIDGGFIYLAMTGGLKTSDPVLLTTVGSLLTAVNGLAVLAGNWWYGSAKGSADKDATLAAMAASPTVNTAQTINQTTSDKPKETTVAA